MNMIFIFGAAVFAAQASPSLCQAPDTVEVDNANPRHVVYSHPVIEFISIAPRAVVREIGDRARPPDADEATLTLFMRNAGAERETVRLRGPDCSNAVEPMEIEPGGTAAFEWTTPVDAIPYDGVIFLERVENGAFIECDRIEVHPPAALRVGLLIERETLAAGDAQFGSFVRRMRHSFEELHDLFDDTASTIEGEAREKVRDRFRIEFVDAYDRDALPPRFWNHPDLDLVIACDEGGPLGGFYLPAYSIGHNFFHRTTRRGLWSRWGEQALWHELLHFRGVPDYYIYPIPAEALPGRAAARIDLPQRWRDDIMNDAYRDPPRIGSLTAKVANAKRGVARVGACEEANHEFGHMWRWIPRRLRVELVEGDGDRPMIGVIVSVYRSRPAGLADGRIQGIATDRGADAETATDENGQVVLESEYMGPMAAPRAERSLWLLVEAERAGEKRFAIITGLELNERFARGEREEAAIILRWNELSPVAGQ